MVHGMIQGAVPGTVPGKLPGTLYGKVIGTPHNTVHGTVRGMVQWETRRRLCWCILCPLPAYENVAGTAKEEGGPAHVLTAGRTQAQAVLAEGKCVTICMAVGEGGRGVDNIYRRACRMVIWMVSRSCPPSWACLPRLPATVVTLLPLLLLLLS